MVLSRRLSLLLRGCAAVVVLALGAYASHVFFGLGGEGTDAFFNGVVYNGLMLAGVGACLARAALVADERVAWLVLGLGLLAWTGGELYFTVAYSAVELPPFPSPSDALYLAFYPASYVTLVMLLRRRIANLQASACLDAAIGGLAVAALVAAVAFEPILDATSGDAAAVAVTLAYPIADLVLLALVVAVFSLSGWKPGRAWVLIGAGLTAMAAADVVYLFQAARGTYVEGTPVDLLWPACALLVGLGAWQPATVHAGAELERTRVIALLARLGGRLHAAVLPFGEAYRLGGDEFCALVRPGRAGLESVVAGAAAALTEHGDGFEVSSAYGTVTAPHETTDPAEALQLADRRMYARKGGRRGSASRQTRDVLLSTLREREPELHEHLRDVAELSLSVGRELGLGPEALDELARAAELHDVGKMAIPDAILSKPGPLDEAEWAFMRRHTVIGERILGAAPALRPVGKIVRSSHERWDGDGYPDGLSEHEIPIGARIVCVCDAFHAMTAERSYRSSVSREAALEELRRCAGAQFDADVVEGLVGVVTAEDRETRHRSRLRRA